jgi:RNA polymerase sigma-70 factor (ECF subfamily)
MTQSPEGDLHALERFRPYLQLLARVQLAARLRAKLDPSDIVQQSLVNAVQGIAGYRGRSDAEMAVWLRQILANHLANVVRDFGREKRDMRREQSMQAALNDSSARLDAWLAMEQSSPSERAIRAEQGLALATALTALPEAQREAVTLHHLADWTLAQVGEHLGRSPAAVAGLIKRGLQSLRQELNAGV